MPDINFLSEALARIGSAPPHTPPSPAPDLDFLSQSFSGPVTSKRLALARELERTRQEQVGVDINLDLATGAERALLFAEPYRQKFETPISTALNAPGELMRNIGLAPANAPDIYGGPLAVVPEEDIRTLGRFASQALRIPEPVATGVIGGVADVAASFTTPEMALLASRLPKADPRTRQVAGAAFAGQMTGAVPEEARHLGELSVTGTPEEQIRAATGLGASAAFITSLGVHPEVALRREQNAAVLPVESRMMDDYFRQQEADAVEGAQRAERAQMLRSIRGSTPGRRAAARMAEEEVPRGTPVPTVEFRPPEQDFRVVVSAPRGEDPGYVQIVDPRATEGSGAIQLPPGSPDFSKLPSGNYTYAEAVAKLSEVQKPNDFDGAQRVAEQLGLRVQEQPGFEEVPASWQFDYRPTGGEQGFTFQMPEGASAEQIASRMAEKKAQFAAAAPPEAVTLTVAEQKSLDAQGDYYTGPDFGKPYFGKNEGAIDVEASVQPQTPRLLLKSNVFAEQLPEFPMERKDRSGDVIAANIGYDPKGFISVRGSSKLSSYRIPLSALPQGTWEKTKGGLSVDRSAVLDFLNDPGKRRSAMSVTGNAGRLHPEDIAENLKTAKPVGRPSTGEGATIHEVTVDPKTLEAIAPAAPVSAEMGSITRAAFERLLQTNPALVETLLRRRPAELDDAFWSEVKAELARMPEYAADPRKSDALVLSLKALKEEGSSELEWYRSDWEAIPPGTDAVLISLESAQETVRQLVGGLPPNIRLFSNPSAPLGWVFYRPGELPRIELNLVKHYSPEALRDTLLEELLHPLQSDPTLRQSFLQIEARIAEADIAKQRTAGYRPDELVTEAANELVRTLYAQHAEANVFRRAVNQVTLAIKRTFGMDLTDQQVALFLVNRALKNRRAAASGQKRLVTKNAVITAPDEPSLAIAAHHGTPHRVDRFSTTKIGTGEGAQVYGWGLYMAENPSVAKDYADRLGGTRTRIPYIDFGNAESVRVETESQAAASRLLQRLKGRGNAAAENQLNWENVPQDVRDEFWKYFASFDELSYRDEKQGNQYTVSLNADPVDFLDWDKPLNQQSEKVLGFLEKAGHARELLAGEGGVETWYTKLANAIGEKQNFGETDFQGNIYSPKAASEHLLSLGIKGIRYLDQGSRRQEHALPNGGDSWFRTMPEAEAAVREWTGKALPDGTIYQPVITAHVGGFQLFHEPAEKTFNYVVFDENIIRITHENGKEVPLREAMSEASSVNAALESPEKVEQFTEPMTHKPEFYRDMARVLNKGLVEPLVIERFEALSAGAKGELAKVFPGRIGTYRDADGNVVQGPSFREVMRDAARTPEERNDYARNGLAEFTLYQKDRQDVYNRLTNTKRDLDEAVIKAITDTPPTNEAELLSTSLMGGILDKIKAERGEAVEGAQTNERIREGIDNIERLNDLLRSPVASNRALQGIANQVGNDALMAAKPGGEALDLISDGTGFPGGVFATPREWIRALATHLDQLTRSDGSKSILAGRDVIESTLYGLRQMADARQALMEVRMTQDGTLRQFNAEYMEDLRSKVPKGFNTILRKYAKAQVESDALTAAFKRLNRRIDTLTEREGNLEEAAEFLRQHDLDPDFRDFGRAVVEYTGARDMQYTENGPVIEYVHPLTGDPVRVEHTFDKGETVETIGVLRNLAMAGLEYAARPNADPMKAAFWTDFAAQMDDYLLVASPDFNRLQDPLLNPLRLMTKYPRYFLISESTLSRIPGLPAQEATRANQALVTAMKTKNEFQKDTEANVLAANVTARRTHPDMNLDQWQKQIAAPIFDSMQHYGQTPYKAGDRIVGFGHLITREDMKAVDGQYRYEQVLRRLHERARMPVLTETPVRIKEGATLQRLALSRGPKTITRFLPKASRDLPAQWKAAVGAKIVEGMEGQMNPVDRFLNSGENFVRVMLGHVMEEERDYFQLGKGPFARDYTALRLEKQALQASGEMPNNLDSLSEWLANHHNEHLAEATAPVTAGDVRKSLIEEVSRYMARIGEDTLEKANAAKLDIVSHENGFTQPRGGKIAPGTLYHYGLPDRPSMVAKGNDAVEFYVIRFRDALKTLHTALLNQRRELSDKMRELYGSEGIGARRKLDAGIRAGTDLALQRFQLTASEVDGNLHKIGGLLNNMADVLHRREAFFGDDIANRTFAPWLGSAVGTVLMRPLTWLRNASGGSVMWALKSAELRRGGWLTAAPTVLKQHLVQFMNTALLRFTPRNAKERAVKRFLDDNPGMVDGTADFWTALMREAADREQLRRTGVTDSFSAREYLGWDSERPVLQNLKAAMDTLRNVTARPETSEVKAVFGYLGMMPRVWQIATRKIGQRWADNWINGQSTIFANQLAEQLRLRAIKAFDARLQDDPVFKQFYEQYGDNFQRFVLALVGSGKGGLLTPAEITGRWDPRTMEKAAIQLRRTFSRNNDAADILMLRYWWNKRAANGDRNAPFMTDGQRHALMLSLAEDVNLGTLASRATWFAGSKERQWLGVLSQYWLWATDRLQDIVAKPHNQRTLGVRYAPAAIGFLMASAIAGVLSTTIGQKANDELFNTVSQKPSFWDATDDATRLKVVAANAASYWGAMGSLVAMFMDAPGKLGYRNPVFFANVVTDLLNVGISGYQSGDYAGPTMNFLAKYNPAAQAVINRLPSRAGLLEVRNASNALRAATPDSLEAKRRQPSSGSDFRSTPMTPLYNSILNAAAEGDWATVDAQWAKAVEQQRAMGNANPEAAILSAIRTRAPESAVYQRVLTPEERELVYSRLTPEARAQLERTNAVFDELATRYGRGAGAGGLAASGFAPLRGIESPRIDRVSTLQPLSLGAPRGVRRGFRTRSLLRRGRMRSLRGQRTRRLRTRLPRLRV